MRWEVTRRHPYYLAWWRYARDHYRNEPVGDQAESLLRQAAVAILAAISVCDTPPNPNVAFEQLSAEDLNPAWLSGAVHPITMRGLAALLIAALPKDTVGYVGAKLIEAACDDIEDEPPRRIKALSELSILDKPGLDAYPDEPIVSINPAASGRQVNEAVTQLLPQWKQERNLLEKRDRSDKYADYLRVWDLREGWHDGTYYRTQERMLREVASDLQMSLTTVHNHYRHAFEMIVGHPYSPQLWFRILGPLKLSDLYGTELGPVSRNRPSTSPTRRDIPESVLTSPSVDGSTRGPIALGATSSGDVEFLRLLHDIHRLVVQGWTDRAIVERLELPEAFIPAIPYLRQRGSELV
jgi:hypothetical protein